MLRRTVLQGLASAAGISFGLSDPRAWADTKPGRWLKVESPNFVVYSSDTEANTRKELAALEGYHALLTRFVRPSSRPSLKLTVYFAGVDRDFDMSYPGMSSSVAGYYQASVEEIRAVMSVEAGGQQQRDVRKKVRAFDPRLILFHEYAHHYLFANRRVTYPGWYVEGFAEYLSTADFTDKGVYIGKMTPYRAAFAAAGDWISIDKFLGKWPTSMSGMEANQYYSQAWLTTHYLFTTPERAQGFDRYIAALQKGGDVIGAFEPAFGISTAAFDKELRKYRNSGIEFRLEEGVKADPNVEMKIERLDRAADDLMMPCAHLRSGPSVKNAAKSVATIRAQAKKYPDSAYAQRSLALAEVWYGDLPAARALLDGLLASDAKNAELNHLSGLCDLRTFYKTAEGARDVALARKAKASFANADAYDGSRSASLFRYLEASLAAGDELDDHLLEVSLLAYQMAPQVGQMAMMAAQALMLHGKFDEAAIVLQPLTVSVHGEEFAKIARAMLAEAQAKKPVKQVFYGGVLEPEEDKDDKDDAGGKKDE